MNFLGDIRIFVELLRTCVGEGVIVNGIIATFGRYPICVEKVIVGRNPVTIDKVRASKSQRQNVIASLLLRYVQAASPHGYLLETMIPGFQVLAREDVFDRFAFL